MAKWYSEGKLKSEIAGKLRRHKSTIGREIKRNGWQQEYYIAIHAQLVAKDRQRKARERHPLKNKKVYAYVLRKLRDGWSPELISGRLKEVEHSDDPSWHICHETIYQFIYAKENKNLRLWEYLPRKQKKRKKQRGRGVHKSRIPQRVSISKRSDKANNREEFGHWEGDTVEGKRSEKDGIHTEVERISRYLAAKKVERITSKETADVQLEIFVPLPEESVKSTTLDNGKEFHEHTRLNQEGIKTFFANPYSSWQRGTNENTNGLLRRYLPKGSSFKNLTQEELDAIVAEINNRPKKCLGYNTPVEVFNNYVEVALQN